MPHLGNARSLGDDKNLWENLVFENVDPASVGGFFVRCDSPLARFYSFLKTRAHGTPCDASVAGDFRIPCELPFPEVLTASVPPSSQKYGRRLKHRLRGMAMVNGLFAYLS